MDLFVKFWGTRGSIPTPGEHTQRYGGNTACVEVRHGETLIIFDAGSGIRMLGEDLLARSSKPVVAHLLLSHCHWDHIQGFPFFSPAFRPDCRLFIYGRHPGDDLFYRQVSGQMDSHYFPIAFQALKAEIRPSDLVSSGNRIGQVAVDWTELPHPGGCLGYSLRIGNSKVVYLTDHELSMVGEDRVRGLRPVPAELVDFARDAELLICDGQYTDEEYAERIGWGHTAVSMAVDLALHANARHLALFHHDPAHSDLELDDLVEWSRARVQVHGGSLVVTAAREGVEFRYPVS